jgi:DNA-binding GntR family transcriptional regulator
MTVGAEGRDQPTPMPSAAPLAEAPPPRGASGREGACAPIRASGVLTDRMAAALVHREPGWRLPRRSALARRYNVSLTEIDAAINDLARRSLVRRLPDGQLYRASPADYWIPVEGAAGFGTRLDPMGGTIACQARHVSRRTAPQEVAWALRLPAGAPIRVVKCVWVSAGDPAAVSTAYLHDPFADEDTEPDLQTDPEVSSFGSMLDSLPAAAVSVEMSPPQPSIARSLRLSPGQPVITVTVRFDDSSTGEPAGLTVVMMKPELFRIAIDTSETPASTSLLPLTAPETVTVWTRARCTWDAGKEMPAEVVTEAKRMPRRARYLVPRGLPRRGEILAACVVLAVLAHVLFAQLTILLAAVFYLITKATRWRLSWLTVPAAAAVAWTVAVGPRAAAAGFADGPAQVASYLGTSGHQVNHLLHFTAAFAGIGTWLPRQLPLAILAGAAEAALAGWLSWLHTDEWSVPPARPGLIVAARRAATVRAIRTGGVVTRDGGCLGVVAGSGARVALSWSEAAGGISVCGSAEQDVLATSLQLVHAAVRRRKPVLAVDLTSDPDLPGKLAAVCAEAGAPLQVFGDRAAGLAGSADGRIRPACYEPFRHGDPAWRASLITAMLNWEGPGRQYRRSCAAYLEDVFELLDAAPGDPRVAVLDEVIHLLNPTAMRARMEYVPAAYPRRGALAERTRVSVSLINAEPATTAQLAQQLRELRASVFGPWLRPSGRGPAAEIDLGRAVTERSVVLFRLGGTAQPASSAMLTRLVCQDLLAAGAALSRIGVDGDGIVWLAECASLPKQSVTGMIARGAGAGLPVLAATTSPQAGAELAELTNVLVAHRMNDAAAALHLARVAGTADPELPPGAAGDRTSLAPGPTAETGGLSALRDGEFLLAVKEPQRLVPRGLLVRARTPPVTVDSGSAAAPPRAWPGWEGT